MQEKYKKEKIDEIVNEIGDNSFCDLYRLLSKELTFFKQRKKRVLEIAQLLGLNISTLVENFYMANDLNKRIDILQAIALQQEKNESGD